MGEEIAHRNERSMNAQTKALVEAALTLARIQIEGVEDKIGFNNADKNVGAFLANVVATDPSDEASFVALANLVAVKYRGQSAPLLGVHLEPLRLIAKGNGLTPEQRARARNTVVAQPDNHEKFGVRLLLSFQFNMAFAAAIKDNGGKAFHGPDGWKWIVRPAAVAQTIAELKQRGAIIVGTTDLGDIVNIPAAVKGKRVIRATYKAGFIDLGFEYDQALVEAIKTLEWRRFNVETKSWTIKIRNAASAIEVFQRVGPDVNVDELVAIAEAHAPDVAKPVEVQRERYAVEIPEKFHDYQRKGVEFLAKDLFDARTSMVNGASIQGVILGDDMGLGKTAQAIIAADGIAGPDGRVVILCPASVKLNWKREIIMWAGPDQKVCIANAVPCPDCGHGAALHTFKTCLCRVEQIDAPAVMGEHPDGTPKVVTPAKIKGKPAHRDSDTWAYTCGCTQASLGGPDPSARWNIVNYDIGLQWYEDLRAMGYDVLIADEAHYAKNRESSRSRLLTGGKVVMQRLPDAKNKATKEARHIDGLSSLASKRVMLLTGTPLTNRPRDLFPLLKACGHPLGRKFFDFANRFCDPQVSIGKTGRVFGKTYNGASNIDELRAAIEPIFLQRKKDDELDLPGKQRAWTPVEIELKKYNAIMAQYEARREAGELSSSEHHFALLGEARMCAAQAKAPISIEFIKDAIENGEKIIVFSGFVSVLDTIAAAFGDEVVRLDGSMSQSARQKSIDGFQNDPTKLVFLGQLIAAGVGITLTAGTQVLMNDLDWVPANHKQAEDRAYRIGQSKMVNVNYLVAAGTFDEDMAVMIEEKIDLVNAFEGVSDSIFVDLVKRLAEAPQNVEVRALYEKRMRGA
jgi:SWI/SNF-related matrix-associated actin-dependent regulator 1 of chromatin subfamily A